MNTITRRSSSIHIFLVDGEPDGLRTVEKPGWTGMAIVCPRSRFPAVKAIEEFAREFDRAGVYVLRGPSSDGDLPIVYIGEGDPTRPRLEMHHREKDWWTSLIVFTGKNLNKAHVQYVEARLVSLAGNAKRCVLDNGNKPQLPTLSIPDTAAMEAFLEEMLVIYPVLGLTAFEMPSQPAKVSPTTKAVPGTPVVADTTTLKLDAKGIKAAGYEKGDEFVVLTGSGAVGDEKITPSTAKQFPSLVNMRQNLIKLSVLVAEGDHFKFTQDYSFNSPGRAASVVLGSHVNGLDYWMDDQGRTLKAIQQAAIGT